MKQPLRNLVAGTRRPGHDRRRLDPSGEDEAIFDVHRRIEAAVPGLLTIIAPRHPERGAEIARLAEAAELKPVLRSAGGRAGPHDGHLHLRYGRRAWIDLPVDPDRVHGRLAGEPWRAEPDRSDPLRCRDSAWAVRVELHRYLRRTRSVQRRRTGRRCGRARNATSPPGSRTRRRANARARRRNTRSSSSGAPCNEHWRRSIPISCSCGCRADTTMREPAFWWERAEPRGATVGAAFALLRRRRRPTLASNAAHACRCR